MKGGLAALVLAVIAIVAACSTEEPVRFTDGGCVAEACQGAGGPNSSGAAGGNCTPDASCAVSFKNTIFPILDTQAGCTAANCHAAGTANGNLELDPGAADAAYNEILNYVFGKTSSSPYIVPCAPQASKMLCNLAVAGTNPYPPCGIAMPVGKMITQAQFDQISEWIACGAPAN